MNKNENLYVISCVGKDLVDLVRLITSVVAGVNANIIDINQSVSHGFFSIFIIVDITDLKTEISYFYKKIHDVGNQTGLKIILE